MVNVKEITVGLLFFGALVALGVLTIMLSDFDLFEKVHYYDVYFDQANELKVQDNVLIMGTRQASTSTMRRRRSVRPDRPKVRSATAAQRSRGVMGRPGSRSRGVLIQAAGPCSSSPRRTWKLQWKPGGTALR